MTENYHAMRFSQFKKYCKFVDSESEGRYWTVECKHKRNTQGIGPHHTKACHKHFCPVFKRARVIRPNIVGGISKNDSYYRVEQEG